MCHVAFYRTWVSLNGRSTATAAGISYFRQSSQVPTMANPTPAVSIARQSLATVRRWDAFRCSRGRHSRYRWGFSWVESQYSVIKLSRCQYCVAYLIKCLFRHHFAPTPCFRATVLADGADWAKISLMRLAVGASSIMHSCCPSCFDW